MSHVEVVEAGDAALEVEAWGEGEPVVVIQTALTVDELRPLAIQLASRGGCRVIHYHRRGYAGSGPALPTSSVAADAADCRALLAALGIGSAHVVGASYSAAIALTLASESPGSVRTLTVLEPPPMGVPSEHQFLAANVRLLETFSARGASAAVDELLTMLAGPDWRRESEQALPGSVAAMERDAPTFFDCDLPALLAWHFGTADAERIHCPVLHVGGSDSGPWFAEVRARMLTLVPQLEEATVHGAGHLLAATHSSATATHVVGFLGRHARLGGA